MSKLSNLQLSRRRFLALCLATAGAASLPSIIRLNALRTYALMSWPGFTGGQKKVLAAAADTVIPGTTVNGKLGAVVVPAAGQTGTVDFIENLLSGNFIFAGGAVRPAYVKLPAGVSATPFPSPGSIPLDGPSGTTHLWLLKRIGWFGDEPRPTRAYSWPSELERLRSLYAAGIDDLNKRAAGYGFPSFDAMPAEGLPFSRDLVLRQLQVDEVNSFNGQGETGNVNNQGVRGPSQPFFLTFLDHVTEACFGDPAYGGNKDSVYWRAIAFTGPAYVSAEGPQPGNGWTPRDMTQAFDPSKTWGEWSIP